MNLIRITYAVETEILEKLKPEIQLVKYRIGIAYLSELEKTNVIHIMQLWIILWGSRLGMINPVLKKVFTVHSSMDMEI